MVNANGLSKPVAHKSNDVFLTLYDHMKNVLYSILIYYYALYFVSYF